MLSASYHVTKDTVMKTYSSVTNVHYLTLGVPGHSLCDLAIFMQTAEDVQRLIEKLKELQGCMTQAAA